MARSGAMPCWRGKEDAAAFVPGIPEKIPRARTLGVLFSAMRCCTRCELALGRTQVVIGDGAPRADIMFIGEAPGAQEDVAGRPFVGAGGRLFDTLLAANGIERSTVYVTNVVACRPPGNRTPRPREVLAHAPWLEEQIRLVRPSIIATLGRSALTYFIPGAKITELSGRPQQIMWQERALTVVPLFHPAAVLRSRELRPKLEAGLSELRRLRDAHAKPASRRSKRD